MKTSESLKALAPALLRAQKAIEAASKSAVNPFFKSKYANLSAVIEACKEHLNKEDLVVVQPVGKDELGHYVTTRILHSSGEYMEDRLHLLDAAMGDPQKQGSAISYARRYGIQSFLFMDAEDDDANAVTLKSPPAPEQVKAKAPFVGGMQFPEQPARPPIAAPEEFVVPYGNDKGKKLKDIAISEIHNNLAYWENRARVSGKPLTGQPKDYCDAMRAILDKQPTTGVEEPFDVPF